MEDYLFFLANQPQCKGRPVFTSMANVFSELYWQLIENFVYTMVKFDVSDCAAVVCVSDAGCMRRCRESHFPCIDFQYEQFHPNTKLPSALEQIGELKLFHFPKALKRGVDLIMIDLDVGFLESPVHLWDMIQNNVDIYVQKDIAYVMNRSLAGWKTWFTEPLPNIGVFFAKGNDKTVKMFDIAWKDYMSINKPIKHNPGKDQNKVSMAMRVSRHAHGLRWRYFPADKVVLLDMVYKFHDPRYEFGGEAAVAVLNPAMSSHSDALFRRRYVPVRRMVGEHTQDVGGVSKDGGIQMVHTTCYEQKVKVNGLKTTNAYWNPFYYDASRRTITKPLVYITDLQLVREIRTLMYLAHVSNRSVIIPNVLAPNTIERYTEYFRDRAMWPWFRIPFLHNKFELPNLQIIEPSYYWRIERDYLDSEDDRSLIPRPSLINVTASRQGTGGNFDGKGVDLQALEREVLRSSRPRLVLNTHFADNLEEKAAATFDWAMDSVGGYRDYETETSDYIALPNLQSFRQVSAPEVARHLTQRVRLCQNLFDFNRGNRSCFDKCD